MECSSLRVSVYIIQISLHIFGQIDPRHCWKSVRPSTSSTLITLDFAKCSRARSQHFVANIGACSGYRFLAISLVEAMRRSAARGIRSHFYYKTQCLCMQMASFLPVATFVTSTTASDSTLSMRFLVWARENSIWPETIK